MRLFEKVVMITGALAFISGISNAVINRDVSHLLSSQLIFNSLAGLCLIGLLILSVGWREK